MRTRSEIEEYLKHIPSNETEIVIIELLLDIRHLISAMS